MTFASVTLLSFNRPAFLGTAIETMRRTELPFELIVHDDGSTDEEVYEVLRHYLRLGYISTLILNKPGHNQGVGHAIKRGFDMARGDLLIKADQDLVFHELWLETVRAVWDSSRGVDLGLLGFFKYEHDPVDYRKTLIEDYGTFSTHTHICGSAFAVPRPYYEMFGIEEHSSAFAEDWNLMRRMAEDGIACGLPAQDVVTNVGFGVGPSTVVTAPNTVQSIHDTPYLIGA